MWKREERIQTVTPGVQSTAGSARPARSNAKRDVVVGKSVVVKGELHGDEDVTIEGQVEGRITLQQHVLTVGTHGRIHAEVLARSVVVLGEVVGNIEAAETVSIRAEGTVDGDIKAPRVAIADGASFRGGIDMEQGQQRQQAQQRQQTQGTGSEPRLRPEPRRPAPAAKAK